MIGRSRLSWYFRPYYPIKLHLVETCYMISNLVLKSFMKMIIFILHSDLFKSFHHNHFDFDFKINFRMNIYTLSFFFFVKLLNDLINHWHECLCVWSGCEKSRKLTKAMTHVLFLFGSCLRGCNYVMKAE